jgi:hypothetical protein
MPWEHLPNPWQYVVLHHEVAHDIEADLKLRPVLLKSMKDTLPAAGVPAARVSVWLQWTGEVFADLCALQLGGSAFAEELMHLLLLPHEQVNTFNCADPHPTPYIRVLLNAAYVRRLGDLKDIQEEAESVESRWKAVFGDSSGDPRLNAFQHDFTAVFRALMDTPFAALNGRSIRELVPFSEGDHAMIKSSERFFRTGMRRPEELPLRHTASAARLAIRELARTGDVPDDVCDAIHARVVKYVRDFASPGLRRGNPEAHDRFIASFAKVICV